MATARPCGDPGPTGRPPPQSAAGPPRRERRRSRRATAPAGRCRLRPRAIAIPARGRSGTTPNPSTVPASISRDGCLSTSSPTRQVDDDVGDAETRVQLRARLPSRSIDNSKCPSFGSVPRQRRVFCRHPKCAAGRLEFACQIDKVHDMADVDPAFGNRDHEPAAAIAQIGGDDDGLRSLAGSVWRRRPSPSRPDGNALLVPGHDVGRTHENDMKTRMTGDGRFILAVAARWTLYPPS